MNFKNINIKVGAIGACMAGLALSLASCNDKWDDHYDVKTLTGETIWTAISANSDLSNFARVADSCGYSTRLKGDNMLTVFAPVNSVLTEYKADSLINEYKSQKASGTEDDDNTVIKQFLNNHVALYNTSVSTGTNDSIVMLNGKYMVLTNNTFGSTNLMLKNQLYDNGILYTVDNIEAYFPNVFEALDLYSEVDSIKNFLYSYNEYEFDAEKSVPGGIVDGKTVYLDSVVNLSNDLIRSYGYIDREDSVYWMLAPTNDQWNSLVEKYSEYFNYDNVVRRDDGGDSLQWTYTRQAILAAGIFNIKQMKSVEDSVMNTSYNSYWDQIGEPNYYNKFYRPYDTGGIFANVDTKTCSNGQLMISKDVEWPISEFETFVQEEQIEGEYTSYVDSIINAREPLSIIDVDENNPYYDIVSEHQYVEVSPLSTTRPQVRYIVPNLLSNVGYDIYVATVPAFAGDSTTTDNLPMKFRVSLQWHNQTGANAASQTLRYNGVTDFETTPGEYDIIQVAENQQIPTCSYGLGFDDAQVHMFIESRVTRTQTSQYTQRLRIDYILFKPHVE